MSENSDLHSTRVHIMMSQSELLAIDEWRRQQADLPTRAAAIRHLIRLGLTAKTPKSKR